MNEDLRNAEVIDFEIPTKPPKMENNISDTVAETNADIPTEPLIQNEDFNTEEPEVSIPTETEEVPVEPTISVPENNIEEQYEPDTNITVPTIEVPSTSIDDNNDVQVKPIMTTPIIGVDSEIESEEPSFEQEPEVSEQEMEPEISEDSNTQFEEQTYSEDIPSSSIQEMSDQNQMSEPKKEGNAKMILLLAVAIIIFVVFIVLKVKKII